VTTELNVSVTISPVVATVVLVDGGYVITGSGVASVTAAGTGNLTATPTSGAVVIDVSSALMATITGKASLASPAFTGVPTAPTASPGTNTTQLATTAFVIAATGSGDYLPIFNVMDYGAVGNGSTDDTSSVQSAITAAAAAGGGIVYFPTNHQFLITSTLNLPVTATQTSFYPGSPPIFRSVPLYFMGGGADRNNRGDQTLFGSLIYWNPPTAGTTFVQGLGSGTFELSHLEVRDTSANSNLFFYMTNTVFHIHDAAFSGNTSFGNGAGTGAQTDLLQTGGSAATTANGSTNAWYQGYGSTVKDITLRSMRRVATMYGSTNQLVFENVEISNTCGTGRSGDSPYFFDGASANVIRNCTIELGGASSGALQPVGWQYGIQFTNGSSNNEVDGTGFWDAVSVTAAMLFDSTSLGNVYTPGECTTSTGAQLTLAAGAGAGDQINMNPGGTGGTGVVIAAPYIPIGGILLWPTNTPPFGFFVCDGVTQLIANYPALFAVLGTAYGGNGTTTFGLPNFVGNFPLGNSTGAGTTGGTSSISVANLPSHTHPPASGAVGFISGGSGYASASVNPGSGYTEPTVTGPTGSGVAYWPPYIEMLYIIRGV
jgi:hypothetical protein